ncbi:hypothetical protein D3C87_1442560 [compost metagenome]
MTDRVRFERGLAQRTMVSLSKYFIASNVIKSSFCAEKTSAMIALTSSGDCSNTASVKWGGYPNSCIELLASNKLASSHSFRISLAVMLQLFRQIPYCICCVHCSLLLDLTSTRCCGSTVCLGSKQPASVAYLPLIDGICRLWQDSYAEPSARNSYVGGYHEADTFAEANRTLSA